MQSELKNSYRFPVYLWLYLKQFSQSETFVCLQLVLYKMTSVKHA